METDEAAAKPVAVHHIAIATKDMKGQLEFFTQVLGMELVGLFWMHGVPGGRHSFLRLGDSCSLSFVELPAMADVDAEIGRTHAGNGAGVCAPGAMQHLAFDVADETALLAMRDRIRSHGVNVFGPIDHGMCKSVYFAGPENLTLELATSARAIDGDAWIDPEVCAACGIDAADLERFKRPSPTVDRGGAVAQPPIDPSKPRMSYPDKVYARMVAATDEEIAATSYADPPVRSAETG